MFIVKLTGGLLEKSLLIDADEVIVPGVINKDYKFYKNNKLVAVVKDFELSYFYKKNEVQQWKDSTNTH